MGRSARLTVNERGTNLVLRKMRAAGTKLSAAQQETGLFFGKLFTEQARSIIRQKAPKSKGDLANSIFYEQKKANHGWKTKITTNQPYAKKVEAGRPTEQVDITPELRDWVGRVLGKEARKGLRYKRKMVVGKGNNPGYDTFMGMRFFQTPFEENKNVIRRQYMSKVSDVIKTL